MYKKKKFVHSTKFNKRQKLMINKKKYCGKALIHIATDKKACPSLSTRESFRQLYAMFQEKIHKKTSLCTVERNRTIWSLESFRWNAASSEASAFVEICICRLLQPDVYISLRKDTYCQEIICNGNENNNYQIYT